MADNYERYTIQPALPAVLFTPLELRILEAFGVTYEGSKTLYFYSEQPLYGDEEIECSVDELADKSNFVVAQIVDYIEANKLETVNSLYIITMEYLNEDTDVEHLVTVESIFQSILKKSLTQSNEVNEIVIEGAFTCSKMRPGEFGGFVTLITDKTVQSQSTLSILHLMQQASNPNTLNGSIAIPEHDQSSESVNNRIAVVIEGGLVQSVVADDPSDLSVVCIDYDIDCCREDQLIQVKQSDGSFSLASCTYECVTEAAIDLDSVFDVKEAEGKLSQTTSQFWDCECEHDYIHPAIETTCIKCNTNRLDGPDSHISEVLALNNKEDNNHV